MIKPARNIMALVLAIMYLVITMSPLASLAMRSPAVAHAVTGECSGDCDICGCSPERRANHTCCCYLKKRMQSMADCTGKTDDAAHDEGEDQIPECCKKKYAAKKVVTLRCNCPCGSGKQFTFSGAAKTELLPNRFAGLLFPHQQSPQFHDLQHRLTSRHAEPPDPPPKLSLSA